MTKVKGIGIIVEDTSDFESFKALIQRITNKNNIKFRKAVSNGCGKLRRKASSYAFNLYQKGCNMIIIAHDLDRNDYNTLMRDLEHKLSCSPANFNFVCIPIEEIEAWFLSDTDNLKSTFSLSSAPKIKGNPETIASPKEKLEEIIKIYSQNTKIYLNTKHNKILAENVSLNLLNQKCTSFKKLNDFILKCQY